MAASDSKTTTEKLLKTFLKRQVIKTALKSKRQAENYTHFKDEHFLCLHWILWFPFSNERNQWNVHLTAWIEVVNVLWFLRISFDHEKEKLLGCIACTFYPPNSLPHAKTRFPLPGGRQASEGRTHPPGFPLLGRVCVFNGEHYWLSKYCLLSSLVKSLCTFQGGNPSQSYSSSERWHLCFATFTREREKQVNVLTI